MKAMGFGDYASTVTRNNQALRRKRGYLSIDGRNREKKLPVNLKHYPVDREKMDKLSWKATFRELFIMLIIAACTAGAILALGQYF